VCIARAPVAIRGTPGRLAKFLEEPQVPEPTLKRLRPRGGPATTRVGNFAAIWDRNETMGGQGTNSTADTSRLVLEGLFRQSPIAFQVYGADGHSVFVNRAFRDLFGGEPPPEYSVFDDDVLARQGFLTLVRRAFEGEVIHIPPHWYDARELRQVDVREGRRVGIEVTMFPIHGTAGKVEHVALCFKDVTAELERVRERDELAATTEALRRREEELAAILDGMGDAVIATDSRGHIVRMNAVAARLSGFATVEGEGCPFSEIFRIVAEPKREGIHDPVEPMLRDGTVLEREIRGFLVTRDGLLRVIELTASAIRDSRGNVRGAVLVLRDETAKKAAERALRASEERFRATFEQAAVGIAHVAPNGRWLDVNQRLLDMLGYSREELLARTFQDITYPPDLDPDLDLVKRMLDGELTTYTMEKRYVRKDESLVWVELTVALVRDAAENPKYFISVVQDIDARKQAERKLDEISDQLRQAQKMEAVGRLAGGVAHDFNNLLAVVLGHGELALQRLSPADPSHDEMREIVAAAERAASLTRQLLAFSRQQVFELDVLDLNEMLRGMTRMLAPLIGEHIEMRILPGTSLQNVLADRGQIEQVIVNLVVNARDAMPRGGVLTLETDNVELDGAYVAAHPDATRGPHVVLSVTDTGTGIDPATQAHMFEPFFTTKPRDKGTGLGLSTVFGIVRQCGGHVTVSSTIGRGTTFSLCFPATTLPRRSSSIRPAAPDVRGTETVLVVEDDDHVRRVVASMLLHHGYEVFAASNPEEALGLVEADPARVHLLLTDVVMPKMSGAELVTRMRFVRPELKVLFMSGYADETAVDHFELKAEDAFVQKPMTPSSLARKVREVLDTR
jgi:two-component system cell cycle sensor histidine kinase/response regulator CckA